MFPLPILFLLNLVSGLGGTQKLKWVVCAHVYVWLCAVNDCIRVPVCLCEGVTLVVRGAGLSHSHSPLAYMHNSSLPMFTVMRRFAIFFTMVLERIILRWASRLYCAFTCARCTPYIWLYLCAQEHLPHFAHRSKPQMLSIQLSVYLMLGGSILAALWVLW